jgi:hypothetical protein
MRVSHNSEKPNAKAFRGLLPRVYHMAAGLSTGKITFLKYLFMASTEPGMDGL